MVDPNLDEVDGCCAGEDAPGGSGDDVGGLGAAAGREEAEEAGAGRRESHRRRLSRFTLRVSSWLARSTAVEGEDERKRLRDGL